MIGFKSGEKVNKLNLMVFYRKSHSKNSAEKKQIWVKEKREEWKEEKVPVWKITKKQEWATEKKLAYKDVVKGKFKSSNIT